MTANVRPSAAPHPFLEDREIPAAQDGQLACGRCHKLGRPGDAQHPEPRDLPPAPPAQRAMDRRYDPEEGIDA
ncbi:hypothetical protein ACIA8K_06905 [Catenuloplanes sp. NPDC051500]|uniref:hypothetical protein n=1 Tax=Catenuloplanes sp. NPDC051500 TaxID=3363959 RepID=UPI0037B4C9CC